MPRWVKKPSSSECSACYLRSACCLRTRNQCTSAAVRWMCYSRSFKTQATHFTRINSLPAFGPIRLWTRACSGSTLARCAERLCLEPDRCAPRRPLQRPFERRRQVWSQAKAVAEAVNLKCSDTLVSQPFRRQRWRRNSVSGGRFQQIDPCARQNPDGRGD